MHHRKSIRLKGYDYSQAGLYFITICCQDRIHRFGHVENDTMILNEFGIVAYNEWMSTPNIRANVTLGEFIIMPNHIHGIIRILRRGELHSPDNELHSPDNELHSPDNELHSPDNELHSPDNELHSPDDSGVCKTPVRSPSQTIGAIVRGYKSSVTKQLGLLGFNGKLWQRNYYEHIIRNEQSYNTISEYIIKNPAKWADDKFYRL
ncbi:transposase [Gelidibacter sp.]|uniref:transposase n=1 Tax=Gelidibacter sp. TaxID=2018083 RepID=UPI003264FFDF